MAAAAVRYHPADQLPCRGTTPSNHSDKPVETVSLDYGSDSDLVCNPGARYG